MPESENEYEEETGPRFNKAIIGRILAVGLFVALGTFAVVQSISGSGNSTDVTGAAGDKLAAAADGIGDAAHKLKSGVADKTSKFKNAAGNTLNKAAAAFKPKANSFDPNNKHSKFSPNVVKPAGPFKAELTNRVSGGFKPQTTPVVVAKPKTPPAKAPERFAQAPGGVPIIGNKNGFAARTQTKPALSPFNPKPPVNSFGGGKEPLSATANKLKSNVSSAADDLLAKTSNAAKSAGNSIKNTFGNATSRAEAALKDKPGFAPPVVKRTLIDRLPDRRSLPRQPAPRNHLLEISAHRQSRSPILSLSLEALQPKLQRRAQVHPTALLAVRRAARLSIQKPRLDPMAPTPTRRGKQARPRNTTSVQTRRRNRRRFQTLRAQLPEPTAESEPTFALALESVDLRSFRRTFPANDSLKASKPRR